MPPPSAFRPGSTAAALLAVVLPALFPYPAPAQVRSKLENHESEWSHHRYAANAVSVVVSRDGTRSVVVARRADGLLYVVEGTALPGKDPRPGALGAGAAAAGPIGAPAGPLAEAVRAAYDRSEKKETGYFRLAPGTPLISADSLHVAFAGQHRNGWFLVRDGNVYGPFGRVWGVTMPPAPGAGAVACVAEREDGKSSVLTVDDKGRTTEGRAYDAIEDGSLTFSPDGRRLAYAARRGGKAYVVVDGEEGLAYDSVGRPSFSENSARVAHVGRREGRDVIVSDGTESAAHDAARNPVRPGSLALSSDGQHVGYVTGGPGAMTVVIDGAEFRPAAPPRDAGARPANPAKPGYELVVEGSLVFSPDGRRHAFSAKRDGLWTVVVDGAEGRPYVGLSSHPPAFSPDGKHVAYVAERVAGDRVERFVVVDGVEQKPYARIVRPPWFSRDSEHVAYVADRGNGWVVVVDGMEGKPYGCIRGHPILSNDGKAVAYMALAGDERFVAAEEIPYDLTRPLGGSELVLDRSPKFYGIIAENQTRPLQLLLVEERVVQE